MEEKQQLYIIIDTTGRRDMLYMHFLNREAYVCYVGTNHPSDYDRLDD
ncbi:MAG: hypothetical protein WBG71_01320 [Leeuwenhoekiella sp.]